MVWFHPEVAGNCVYEAEKHTDFTIEVHHEKLVKFE